ncbi:MAG: UMP kinase [Leptospirales bacterium]|nr:UMP kinase [Leptospirales bacterium]
MGKSEKPLYRRILLKLSGEALAGHDKTGINPEIIHRIASEVKEVSELGVEVAMVIGAGNIFRGAMAESLGINRSTGDFMGMLATVMNSMAVENTLEKMDQPTRVLTAIEMKHVAEPYTIQKADDHLKKGRIVIAAGGTGHPYFTTDTAASLRAVELGADLLLKATRVDGVYTGDPEKDKDAEKINEISFIDMITKRLKVMDLTAISLCMDNNLPIVVFNLFEKGSLKKIILGEKIGTKIF